MMRNIKISGLSPRRPWKLISVLLLAALAAAVLLKEAIAPAVLRRRLVSEVRQGCETCELSLARVRVSLRPLALDCGRVRFTGGTPNATVIRFEAERVYVPLAFFPLFKGRIRAGLIEIDRPLVKVTEGDLTAPPAPVGGAPLPDFEAEGVAVRNGAFTYARERPGRTGILGVSLLSAAVGPVGSSARFRDADITAGADGLLEGSGKFHLQVRARFPGEIPDADVELRIKGQDLSGLNPFFRPEDGIKLSGLIIDARTSAAVRGARLHAAAYVRYRGLSVKIKQTRERGALSAFFQSFLASLAMNRQNSGAGNYDRKGEADLRRKPKESVISFILRGMKEAAIEVSSQGIKQRPARHDSSVKNRGGRGAISGATYG